VGAAGRKTLETVSAADDIIEALDLAADEEERQAEYQQVGRAGRRELVLGWAGGACSGM
jgi:hypothetical protein